MKRIGLVDRLTLGARRVTQSLLLHLIRLHLLQHIFQIFNHLTFFEFGGCLAVLHVLLCHSILIVLIKLLLNLFLEQFETVIVKHARRLVNVRCADTFSLLTLALLVFFALLLHVRHLRQQLENDLFLNTAVLRQKQLLQQRVLALHV